MFSPVTMLRAETIATRLKGRIVIQVESKGEAYYVHPTSAEAYYMANGDEAYKIMRNLGIGITNKDLDKIKSSKTIAKKYSGIIFLQVESKGEAYYVNYNGDIYYLKNGSEAYNIMRKLGLGISNNDLKKVNIKENKINTLECNGKQWLLCPNGQQFHCPSSGEAVCLPNDQGGNSVDNVAYKKEFVAVGNKYLDKLRSISLGIDKMTERYSSRIEYLQELSSGNDEFLNSYDLNINKLVYSLGSLYKTSIDLEEFKYNSYKKFGSSINELTNETQNNLNKVEQDSSSSNKENWEKSIGSLASLYAGLDYFVDTIDKDLKEFNIRVEESDSMNKKYWDTLKISAQNELKRIEQEKEQREYEVQLNKLYLNLQTFKPISCYSTNYGNLTTTHCY